MLDKLFCTDQTTHHIRFMKVIWSTIGFPISDYTPVYE